MKLAASSNAIPQALRQIGRAAVLLGLVCLSLGAAQAAEDRRAKVLNDRSEVQEDGYWIYNDFAKGIELARTTGKPLLVVLRCVP